MAQHMREVSCRHGWAARDACAQQASEDVTLTSRPLSSPATRQLSPRSGPVSAPGLPAAQQGPVTLTSAWRARVSAACVHCA